MRAGIVYIKLPISAISYEHTNEDVTLLKESIRTYGLLQPVGVIRRETGYRLIFGRRRLKACEQLDHKYIHAVLLSLREDEYKAVGAVENIHKSLKNPLISVAADFKGVRLKDILCLDSEQEKFTVNYMRLDENAKRNVTRDTQKFVNTSMGDSRYFLRMCELEKNIPAAAKEKVRLSVLSDKRIFINEIEKILELMRLGGYNDIVVEEEDRIIIKKNIG